MAKIKKKKKKLRVCFDHMFIYLNLTHKFLRAMFFMFVR